MRTQTLRMVLGVFGILLLIGILVTVISRMRAAADSGAGQQGASRLVPVEVAPIITGTIELRRVFSGSLTASSELRVAPKISGRIARILVDLSDPVERGDEVALLDDAEFTQAVVSARADLAVAQAQAAEAQNRWALAERELERITTLEERGVSSAAALDTARSEFEMRQAAADVAAANLEARKAALETAQIRLSYTRVTATWTEGDDRRLVSERMADEGDTVAANTPLLSVVRIRPIRTVFHVPERDYALLEPGQDVILRTDAFPGETFPGTISRIAPIFREDSRQARVEALSENEAERLKPGMFVRATVVLDAREAARLIPLSAMIRRGGEVGVFLVSDDDASVQWVPIETGIRNSAQAVLLSPEDLSGRVVTLGQQFLGDGSTIRVIDTGRTQR